MSATATIASGPRAYGRRYWVFALPAALIMLAVILFPWIFTLFMSVHDWKVTGETPFVGLANYAKMLTDQRFIGAVWRTLIFTAARSLPRCCWGSGPPSVSPPNSRPEASPEPCSYCR